MPIESASAGELVQIGIIRIHYVDVRVHIHISVVGPKGNLAAIGRPGRIIIACYSLGEIYHIRAISVYHVDVRDPVHPIVVGRHEGDSVQRSLHERQVDGGLRGGRAEGADRKSTRLNSSHVEISYAVFCLKKKNKHIPFAKFIAQNLQRSCQTCHHPGMIAPLSLLPSPHARTWSRARKIEHASRSPYPSVC